MSRFRLMRRSSRTARIRHLSISRVQREDSRLRDRAGESTFDESTLKLGVDHSLKSIQIYADTLHGPIDGSTEHRKAVVNSCRPALDCASRCNCMGESDPDVVRSRGSVATSTLESDGDPVGTVLSHTCSKAAVDPVESAVRV